MEWTVVIRPSTIPNLSLITFTNEETESVNSHLNKSFKEAKTSVKGNKNVRLPWPRGQDNW